MLPPANSYKKEGNAKRMNFLNFVKKISEYLSNPDYRFKINAQLGLYNRMSDEKFLKRMYKIDIGKELDLDNPKTFNEKLNWLKINDRNPLYTTLVDKYEVKSFVSEKIGSQYVVPTIGVWDKFEEIDFDTLPNQFVLKCTHDSGGLVICKDKSTFDFKKAKSKIKKCLKNNYYYHLREWPYKNVKPRIIAEQYMEDSNSGDLKDYKFFAFNGKVKALYIATDRQNKDEEVKFTFFDRDFNYLPFTNAHQNAVELPQKPKCFDEMIMLAEKLSEGIKQVRLDFYEVDEKVYFGEITFFHMSGLNRFHPEEWDAIFGSWIDLK